MVLVDLFGQRVAVNEIDVASVLEYRADELPSWSTPATYGGIQDARAHDRSDHEVNQYLGGTFAEVVAAQVRIAPLARRLDEVVKDEVGVPGKQAEGQDRADGGADAEDGEDMGEGDEAGPEGAGEHGEQTAPHAASLDGRKVAHHEAFLALLADLYQKGLLCSKTSRSVLRWKGFSSTALLSLL